MDSLETFDDQIGRTLARLGLGGENVELGGLVHEVLEEVARLFGVVVRLWSHDDGLLIRLGVECFTEIGECLWEGGWGMELSRYRSAFVVAACGTGACERESGAGYAGRSRQERIPSTGPVPNTPLDCGVLQRISFHASTSFIARQGSAKSLTTGCSYVRVCTFFVGTSRSSSFQVLHRDRVTSGNHEVVDKG